MELTLNSKHELIGTGYFIGVDGENISEQLIINIEPTELLNKWAYLEFQVNEEDKYNTQKLNITDNKIVYDIPNGLLKEGEVKIQVIFRDENNFVWKSFVKRFPISSSINACQNLPEEYPDFITEAQKLLEEISVDADKIDEVIATEKARVEAENARIANENTRIANETNRVNAENTRQTNEALRQQNEAERKTNETVRVNAEATREAKFNTWENTLGVLDNLSNALKGTASGEVVRVDDVSPVEHNAKVKVQGKNLFNPTKLLVAKGWSESNGEYFGSPYELSEIYHSGKQNSLFNQFKSKTQYTLSLTGYINAETEKTGITFNFTYEDGGSHSIFINALTPKKYTLTSPAGKTITALHASYGNDITTYLSNIQLEEGDTATEYTPYVDPTSVTVTRCGKNLFNIDNFIGQTKTNNGITVKVLDTGEIQIQGTPEDTTIETSITFTSSIGYGKSLQLIPGKYIDNFTANTKGDKLRCFPQAITNAGAWIVNLNGYAINIEQNFYLDRFVVYLPAGVSTNINQIWRMQVEAGASVTDYEDHKENLSYSPNTDSSLNITSTAPTMTLLTDKSGVNIELEYNQDINKVIKNLQDKINSLIQS